MLRGDILGTAIIRLQVKESIACAIGHRLIDQLPTTIAYHPVLGLHDGRQQIAFQRQRAALILPYLQQIENIRVGQMLVIHAGNTTQPHPGLLKRRQL